jgi:hypothetical protein
LSFLVVAFAMRDGGDGDGDGDGDSGAAAE